jgi:hypothetical protein
MEDYRVSQEESSPPPPPKAMNFLCSLILKRMFALLGMAVFLLVQTYISEDMHRRHWTEFENIKLFSLCVCVNYH